MKQVLIDAIKLRKDLPKYADYYEALAWIDEAEEVEAIPIEFIKRFATFFPPTPTYMYGEESIDMDAWCEELLEHWEKEKQK